MCWLARVAAADGWAIEDVELRTTYLDQTGRGYQSQAGPAPGSEAMWLVEPWARIRIRQSERVVHEVTVPVDVVTAASPNAVDAISSASKTNEAGELDVRSRWQYTPTTALTTRAMFHQEEQFRSRALGAGWQRSLADDNATIALAGTVAFDSFDDRFPNGVGAGAAARWTMAANASASQILSPTTIGYATYNITQQLGELSPGWTSVPLAGGLGITGEQLPGRRIRQALGLKLAQRVPATRSTLKIGARGYVDTWGVLAGTVDTAVYQTLVRAIDLRAGYRYHRQRGVRFYTRDFQLGPLDEDTPRTADSDLSALGAHEVAVSVTARTQPWRVSAEILRYWRTNDLQITAVSLNVGRSIP